MLIFFAKRKEKAPNYAKKVSMVRLLNSKSVFLVHFFFLWKLLLAAGDNTTEGREFRRVKGSSTTTSTRGRRRLTTACTQDQYLCDWGAGGSAEPKYAVCTVGGESACVDSSVASTGATFDGGKDGTKTVATCGCCGGVDDEFFCDNLPLDQPNCDPATFGGCDIFNSNFVQFCYSDLSKSGKKKSLKKVDCGDPYTLPAYDRGDTFEGCGSTCDGTNAPTTGPTTSLTLSPTAGPTTSPTSSPTDSCLACDGDVKYYFNPLKTTWEGHRDLALFNGCTLASIDILSNNDEIDAARAALADHKTFEEGAYGWAWLGAKYDSSSTSWVWQDGSGSFTSPQGGIFWGLNEPNNLPTEEPFLAIWIGFDYLSIGQIGFGSFASVPQYSTSPATCASGVCERPALYKCCERTPQDYSSCRVPAPTP